MKRALTSALFALLLAAPTFAGEGELNLDQFTRAVEKENVGDVLQCSIRYYTAPPPSKDGMKMLGPMARMFGAGNKKMPPRPEIVLISMIHLGEKGFYAEASKVLETCDVVLYEEQGDASMSAASGKMIAAATGLAFQGTEIPPNPKTWRSADLTQEQLFKMLGVHPDVMKRMSQMMKQMGNMQQRMSPEQLKSNPMMARMIPTRDKIIAQMKMGASGSGSLEQSLGGGDAANLILHQRNAIAIGEMTKASHEDHKRVAVIYGAAHMPGIDHYLRQRLGYTHTKTTWIDSVYGDPEAAAKAGMAPRPEDEGPSAPSAPAPQKADETKPAPKAAPKAKKKGDDWF